MPRRYGGVKSAQKLDEVQEAIVCKRKEPHFSKLQIAKAMAIISIKLIPTTLLIGLVMWGISFAFLVLPNL